MESIAAEQNGRLEPLDQRAPRRLWWEKIEENGKT